MNFQNLDIHISYINQGPDNLAEKFLVPCLKSTRIYKRSVGYFSSSALIPIIDGIVALARNHGSIQLIASPQLSQDDVEAIKAGYEKRDKIIEEAFSRDFIAEIESIDDTKLQLLSDLIAKGVLDIKIAVTETYGIYHDKLGILEDFDGNVVVFYGSANSSLNAYQENYEKIRVVKSWIAGQNISVKDEQNEFDSLWNGTNAFVKVYKYKDVAAANILKIINIRKEIRNKPEPVQLRDYQEQAIQAWCNNDYHGFYVMATGTGKTWTAIYSAKALIDKHPSMIIICAPYKHLIRQWCDDIIKAFPFAKPVLVSSENPEWDIQIINQIIGKKFNKEMQIIVVSTIASFNSEKFEAVLNRSHEDRLLIVDEAHRFTNRSESIKKKYQYMLGLSATPYSGKSAASGKELMAYFGGQVFNLPIEVALEKGYLVPYNYHPIYLHSTDKDEEAFNYHSRIIMSCFENGHCINEDLLVKEIRNRLRVIALCEEKQSKINEIIESIHSNDHLIVYCGDGKLYDQKTNEEIRHIQEVKRVLTAHGYKASQFTAHENMKERMQLVDAFTNGEISALAAIRCLDEGIDIPSIKSALILASNDDYREFVQRRGRILRTYKDKKIADIYDIIVLPSKSSEAWAKIELRRFYEYGHLAHNWQNIQDDFERLLSKYELNYEDVDVYDFENMEDNSDE